MGHSMDDNTSVLVISATGENLGVMPRQKASGLATDEGLELVEVNASAKPAVYRIMDRGKFNYQKSKKKKPQKDKPTKEMKFNLRIDPHDQETKVKRIRKFLEKGLAVKLYVIMKGRERSRQNLGVDKMNELTAELDGCISCDPMKVSNSQISMLVHPK